MTVVTQRAVLGHRCVFPQERSAFFRVTLITGVVDTAAFQVVFAGRTVWIVAGSAVTRCCWAVNIFVLFLIAVTHEAEFM